MALLLKPLMWCLSQWMPSTGYLQRRTYKYTHPESQMAHTCISLLVGHYNISLTHLFEGKGGDVGEKRRPWAHTLSRDMRVAWKQSWSSWVRICLSSPLIWDKHVSGVCCPHRSLWTQGQTKMPPRSPWTFTVIRITFHELVLESCCKYIYFSHQWLFVK